MSISWPETQDCVFETPTPQRSRKRTYGSVTNLRTQTKRRRLSLPASALELPSDENVDASAEKSRRYSATADRFISNRPKTFLPLNVTPRTNRISKQFGLADDKVLNFRDNTNTLLSPSHHESTISLIRKNASSLFSAVPQRRPTSVMENLHKRRQCTMVLDSPGVPIFPECWPISWSHQNLIAVACGKSVFYQNLDTKVVSQLCSSSFSGYLGVIRWGDTEHESWIATGMSTGHLQIMDAAVQGRGTALHSWVAQSNDGVKSLAWNHNLLTVGMEDGEISMIDIRNPQVPTKVVKHHGRVLALEWDTARLNFASGDSNGRVYIWDSRKTSQPLSRLYHEGSTRALAWCPWKSDLLATGSCEPEGKIRIWSRLSIAPYSPEAIQTIPLNTSVRSLQWSPHCKELLSSHGSSFIPKSAPRRRAVSLGRVKISLETQNRLTYEQTSLTNSLAVHEYPSGKRLMSLPNAHAGAITQTCLGPSGESIFTVCPEEETIKMWQVWSQRLPAPKQESAFDKFTIR